MIHQSIIDLNNRTVELLKQQNYENAMLNSSLLLCRHSWDLRHSSGHEGPASFQNDNRRLDTPWMLLSEVRNSQCSDKPFIYDHGILIPSSTDTESTMVSAIIIFNSALSHHLCAETLFTGAVQQDLLLKAKYMYELAHQAHPVRMSLLFHFAVVNNVAMIEAKTGQNESSKKHFEYLMTVMMFLIDQGHTEQLSHLQGFLVNFMFLNSGIIAPAA